MAVINCNSPGGGFPAQDTVTEQFDYFTALVNDYVAAADGFSQILANYDIIPVKLDDITWDSGSTYVPFNKPSAPGDFREPSRTFTTSPPSQPGIVGIDTSGLNVTPPTNSLPSSPNITIPNAPSITIPPPPVLTLPPVPVEPIVGDVVVPTFDGIILPDVPTLIELNLPATPTIDIKDFNGVAPIVGTPVAVQDQYIEDFQYWFDSISATTIAEAQSVGATAQVQRMFLGGTGLPPAIEQALFDREIGREEVSTLQAVNQSEQEWAAKGFDLPGSTLLARVQEIRQKNRMERGRVNREISIQFHNQEIENLRFAVAEGVKLEGQLLTAQAQIAGVAQSLANGHAAVMQGIFDSLINYTNLQIELYKADIEVYKIGLEAELLKLQIYKTEVEAASLVQDINKSYVDIYVAQIAAVETSVDVFTAEVGAAEAQIKAENSKITIFQGQIDAYEAQVNTLKVRADIYDTEVGAQKTISDVYVSQVNAEEAEVKIYSAQVDAYNARIGAYRSEVEAGATKVNAQVSVEESKTRVYSENVTAWRAGISADTANIEAAVNVYQAELQKYTALLSAEQYRVTGEARNVELNIAEERDKTDLALKQADQAIEQLKHTSALGLSATETAARVNAQLAASAMSAVNVSAGISSTTSGSTSDSRSCTTTFTSTN